jgi:hypothetical protein
MGVHVHASDSEKLNETVSHEHDATRVTCRNVDHAIESCQHEGNDKKIATETGTRIHEIPLDYSNSKLLTSVGGPV